MTDTQWPEWLPESIEKSLIGFWCCLGRRGVEDWQQYVESSVPGGLAAVGQIRTIDRLCSDELATGRFVPMWNNIARVVEDDGTVRAGSFEQTTGVRSLTKQQWLDSAVKLFGANSRAWRFKCPACGNVQSIDSVMELDPSLSADEVSNWISYSCQGRFVTGGCNWTLGGLFRIHKLEVVEPDGSAIPVFCFEEQR